MKLFNSTLLKRSKIQSSTLPSSPKIILFGTPNVDTRLFATRLAIDIGVPVLSIKQIYKTILLFEESYSQELFYRKVISILKNENKVEAAVQLEAESIPEKLLNLTKNTDLGYVLYDYPNNVTQAKNLENQSNGGVNLVVNLQMNKEVAEERERIRFECGGCGREYFNKNVTFQNGVNFDGSFPEDGVCVDVSKDLYMYYLMYYTINTMTYTMNYTIFTMNSVAHMT